MERGDEVDESLGSGMAQKAEAEVKAKALDKEIASGREGRELSVAERRNMVKAKEFNRAWAWSMGFFGWLL
jgi:hypothetical protein